MYLRKEYSSKSVPSASHILDVDKYSMFPLAATEPVILSIIIHSPYTHTTNGLDVVLPAQLIATTEYVYTPVTSLSVYSVVVLDTSAIEMLSRYTEYDVIGLSLTGGDHVRMVEELVSG